MAKPSVSPDWATSGDNTVEPSSGQKSSGWTTNQVPTSGNMNWWMRKVYDWVSWLGAFFDSSDNLVLPEDKHVQLSGTGRLKHGELTVPVAPVGIRTGTWSDVPLSGYIEATASPSEIAVLIPDLGTGTRLKGATFRRYGNGSADLEWEIYRLTSGAPASKVSVASDTVNDTPAAWNSTDCGDLTSGHNTAQGTSYWLRIKVTTGTVMRIGGITCTYDRP